MRPMLVHSTPLYISHYNFFSIDRSIGDDFAARRGDETLSPKLDPITASWRFMTHTICGCNVTTIRNRVTPLNCLPRSLLSGAIFLFFRRMPANCSWIENNLCAAQCR